MNASQDSHIPQTHKNPRRTCRVIAEVLAEWKRSTSRRTSSSKQSSKGGPDSHTGGGTEKKKGRPKKAVLHQTEHSPVDGFSQPVPQQTKKKERPQRGRKRAPEKEDDCRLGADRDGLDRSPAVVDCKAETEDTLVGEPKVRHLREGVEWSDPASRQTDSSNHSSRGDPNSHTAGGTEKKRRGRPKKAVLHQTGYSPVDGFSPPAPQQTQKTERPQRGRKRALPSEKDDSRFGDDRDRLDRSPAETESSSVRQPKVRCVQEQAEQKSPDSRQTDSSKRSSKEGLDCRNGGGTEKKKRGRPKKNVLHQINCQAETEDAPVKEPRVNHVRERRPPKEMLHENTSLCPSPALPSDSLGPGPSSPKPTQHQLTPQHSSTPVGIRRLPQVPPVTADPQKRNTAKNHPKKLQLSPVKRGQSDVLPKKQTRPRKAPGTLSAEPKKTTRKKKEQEVVPARRRRKKGGAEAEPQSQPALRVRPRFEFHETELHESELLNPEQDTSSDLSIELSLQEVAEMSNHSLSLQEEEEEEDEEELPSFLQQANHKPSSIREGLFVWYKLRKYPFWPAMVKSVNHKNKKASIVFVDTSLFDKKSIRKGFTVSLRTLKPLECEDSDRFMDLAREQYGAVIDWSQELISDYRIRIGCGSFVGSFIEYFTDDISYPVRRRFPEGSSELTFPSQQLLIEEQDSEEERPGEPEQEPSAQSDQVHSKKVLPDRAQAARNRANEKLVDFIVKRRGVENRIKAVLSGQEPSKWLQALNTCSRSVMEVYLEDEEQVEKVYRYLENLCKAAAKTRADLECTDQIRYILDVLLPEAIIYAIAEVDSLSLEQAEEKYRRGPRHSNRERQEFDMMIEQQMKFKARAARSSP